MLSLMAVPHLSHLMGLASTDAQISTPTALRGPCSWGDKVGVPAANGATSLVAFCWLTPKIMGATWPVSGSGKYKYKYKCVCVFSTELAHLLLWTCPNGSISCALGTSYPQKVPLYEQRWTTVAPARIAQLSSNLYHLPPHSLGLAWATNGTPSTAINPPRFNKCLYHLEA